MLADVASPKVAWILGAGFSIPLGGPFFKKLISSESLIVLNNWMDFVVQKYAAYDPDECKTHKVDSGTTADIVCQLFEMGLGKAGIDPNRLWNDAEEFLERLEIATEPHDHITSMILQLLGKIRADAHSLQAQAIKSFTGPGGIDKLRGEAIRFIAGACSVFLDRPEQRQNVVDESEQWSPFRRWAEHLTPGADTVITFNYDRSLDILGDYLRRQKRDVLTSPIGDNPDHLEALSKYVVPMYHLHGHVGWLLDPDGKTIKPGEQDSTGFRSNLPVAYKNPGQAVIGIPGQSKLDLSLRLLKQLWTKAMDAIVDADAVVLVGYRFPPTDNMAKGEILKALRRNKKAVVHVILGHRSEDVSRVRGMIELTRGKTSNPVYVHDMGGEDFFAGFDRSDLFRSAYSSRACTRARCS